MINREKIIRIIDELIFEAQKEQTWKAENALRCIKKELLKEQETVVRCKDCIHYRYYGLTDGTVSECKIDHCENPDKEWFCAAGKREKDY